MKLQVNEKPEQDLIKEFPIRGKAQGWFFQITELSNGSYKLVGSDKWSRKIKLDGTNYENLIEKAEAEATKLNGEAYAS